MAPEDHQNEAWDPCPPGTLHELSRPRAIGWGFYGAGLLVGLVAVGVAFSIGWNTAPTSTLPNSEMTCVKVQAILPAYLANEIADDRLKCKICRHVMDCCPCRSVYQKLRDQIRPNPVTRKPAPCKCP